MIRHLFRKHRREHYGDFSICTLCGVLQYFDNGKWKYDFWGQNLTYSMLKDLQPGKKEKDI